MHRLSVGDVLFLERQIPGIPYASGYWVLCQMGDAIAYVALMSENKKLGKYAIDNWYKISVEDLSAFSVTGEIATVPPPSPEALEE